MDEIDFYMLNVGEYMLIDRAYNFFIGLGEKGYLVSDLGICDLKTIEIGGIKYGFDEIEKVPMKNNLEGKLNG